MYGIFTYIWLKLMVNVDKYSSPMDHLGYTLGLSPNIINIDPKES